jgi:hypothetical protein
MYTITKTDGQFLMTVPDGTVNSTLGIALIGSNYQGYGQLMANNFVSLLEHQANSIPPVNPIAGQLWWNTATQVLSYYDGNKFKPCSSSQLGTTPPPSPLDGDQWWNTTTDQLNVWNGSAWQIVGPGYVKGQGYSDLTTDIVYDIADHPHLVSSISLNATPMAVVSNDETFFLSSPIGGITKIQKGINLVANTIINGTALNSQQLGGIAAANYLTSTAPATTLTGSLTVNSLQVGTGNVAIINADAFGEMWVSSAGRLGLRSGFAALEVVGSTITINQQPTLPESVTTKFYVDSNLNQLQVAVMSHTHVTANALVDGAQISTLNGLSNAIGNDPNYALNNTAHLAFKADVLNPTFAGNVAISGAIIPTIDNNSDLGSATKRMHNVYSTAVYSVLADLAENYESDTYYAPGTVVVFGGSKEITQSNFYRDTRIAGVISTAPGYLMNQDGTGLAVALTGKVPCLVLGPVKKGDILVSSGLPGVATKLVGSFEPGCVIGKSMEDDDTFGSRLVTIAVGRF